MKKILLLVAGGILAAVFLFYFILFLTAYQRKIFPIPDFRKGT